MESMSARAYATAADVHERWVASSIPPEDATIGTYLNDAAIAIDTEFPHLREQIKTDENLVARARLVSCRMVIRALLNPDRVRQVQDTTGPFNSGYTLAAETLSDMCLTKDDKAIILGSSRVKRRAFTVDSMPSHGLGVHGEVCNLRFGASYCSCGSCLNRGEGPIYERT